VIMIGFKCKSWFDGKKVKRKANRATFQSLNHAAAAIRITARRSIRRSPKESAAGQPPHTRRGQLKRGILYSVDKRRQSAVIGPAYTIVGRSGSAHEFGRKYYEREYPARSFMGPALRANLHRIPRLWANSIK